MAKKPTIDEEDDPSKFVQEELLPVDPRDAMTAATFHQETGEQVASSIGKDGKEYPDPVPIAPPLDYVPPPDIMSMIRTMIMSERLKEKLREEGYETPEEADDFDIDDDPLDPLTPYERYFEPQEQGEPRPPATPPAAQLSPQAPPVPPAGVSSPPPASEPPAGSSAGAASPPSKQVPST